MAKLPSEVRLQIARVTNKDVWEVEELLQVIKAEVEACEISDTNKVHGVRHSDISCRNMRTTASILMMQEHNPGGRECIYCKEKHYSASCETITGVPARKEALKKEGRCFVGLARGIVLLNAAAPRDAASAATGTINHSVRSTTQHRTQKGHHHKQR